MVRKLTIVGDSKMAKENLQKLSQFSSYTEKTKNAVCVSFLIELSFQNLKKREKRFFLYSKCKYYDNVTTGL